MDKQKITPEKITKPIQLLGAWLAGLLAIDSSFLFAAANMPSGRLPKLAMWAWVAVAALSLPFAFLGWRIFIGLALILSGCIRIWLGVVLRSGVVAGSD